MPLNNNFGNNPGSMGYGWQNTRPQPNTAPVQTYQPSQDPNLGAPQNLVNPSISAPTFMKPKDPPLYISGRVVKEEGDVTPGEIPMDGSVCFFPVPDLSCIYVKGWDGTGTLQTKRFFPEEDQPIPIVQTQQISNDLSTEILERLSRIEGMLGAPVLGNPSQIPDTKNQNGGKHDNNTKNKPRKEETTV